MNEILQKRIEEAAIKVSDVCEPCDYGDPFCASCHRPYMYDSAKKMGEVILNNQWISVEEALPSLGSLCLVDGKSGLKLSIYMNMFVDAGNITQRIDSVTHWMHIPQLKGGE